jgi:oligoendopeptidase F
MQKNQFTFENRNQIPEQYKWKVESIYPDDETWEKEHSEYSNRLSEIDTFKGRLAESADTLLQAIQTIHEIEMHIEKLYVYAHLKKDEDTTNQFYQEMYQKAYSLYVKLSEKESFFVPELLTMEEKTFQTFLAKNPALKEYEHFFENIFRQKKHTLPKEQEELLAMGGEVFSIPGKVFSMLDNADIQYGKIIDEDGNEIPLTKALYGKYQQHPDRRLRKDSYITLYQPYIQHRNTLATNYYGVLQTHVYLSRARKYASTVEMALDRNNIPVSVYENLLDTVHQNLKPNQRYVSLRKQLLGLDEVHDYDLLAPLSPSEHREYSYEEAVEMILEAFAPLGDQYITDVKKGIESGWIDVFENKGKRSGAYSSGGYLTQPFVLLNYSGTLNDIFTLAHELGHSMHSYYTRKNQPYVYGDYSIFLAEIASTLNEGLLTHYLLKHADTREKRIALINEYLDKFARTFYRQVIFAEFELETHRWVENGQPVTADRLDELFGQLYQLYHGPDLVLDRETKAMWSRVPHFYYNYYVFQYATGIAASTALLKAILEEGTPAVQRYLDFLSAGNSDYPLQVLKNAGVDMEKPEPIQAVADSMDELLHQLEDLTRTE